MRPMNRSARGILGLSLIGILVAIVALPALAADPSGTPTSSAAPEASKEPRASKAPKAPKPEKAPKVRKEPGVPVTVTGTVATRTDADGATEYTITVDGKILTLDAGPSWFFKDKHPLKPFVGKRVTIVGETARGRDGGRGRNGRWDASARTGQASVGRWLEGRRRGPSRLDPGEGRSLQGEVRRLLPARPVQGQARQERRPRRIAPGRSLRLIAPRTMRPCACPSPSSSSMRPTTSTPTSNGRRPSPMRPRPAGRGWSRSPSTSSTAATTTVSGPRPGPIPGPFTDAFARGRPTARDAWILIGSLAETSADPDRPYNTSVLHRPGRLDRRDLSQDPPVRRRGRCRPGRSPSRPACRRATEPFVRRRRSASLSA